MLLVIDVGNTNITVGIFQDEKLLGSYRMTTQIQRTSDEFGIFLRELVQCAGVNYDLIKSIIIASVVPNIMYSLTSGCFKYFGVQPMIVGQGIRSGIRLAAENPKEVGADLIVDAVAAKEIYGGPAIVIDYGTATTFELILEDGTLDSVVIVPGILVSIGALSQGTAKLPEVEVKRPKTILAKETNTCIQAGIFYSTIGQTEYIVRKMIEESGLKNVKVIATGGLGKVVADETDVIDVYDNMLTLQGLRLIYNKNRR